MCAASCRIAACLPLYFSVLCTTTILLLLLLLLLLYTTTILLYTIYCYHCCYHCCYHYSATTIVLLYCCSFVSFCESLQQCPAPSFEGPRHAGLPLRRKTTAPINNHKQNQSRYGVTLALSIRVDRWQFGNSDSRTMCGRSISSCANLGSPVLVVPTAASKYSP